MMIFHTVAASFMGLIPLTFAVQSS